MKNIFALAFILTLLALPAEAAFIAGSTIDPKQLTGNADSRVKHKYQPVTAQPMMEDAVANMPGNDDVLLAAVPGSSIETPDTSSDHSIFIFNVVETGYSPATAQYINSTTGDPARYTGAPYQNFRGYDSGWGYSANGGNAYSNVYGYSNTWGYNAPYAY